MTGTQPPRRPRRHTARNQLLLVAIAFVGNVWAYFDLAYHAEGELEGRLVYLVIWGLVALPAMVALLVMAFRANWPVALLGVALLGYLWMVPFLGLGLILLVPWVPRHTRSERRDDRSGTGGADHGVTAGRPNDGAAT